MNPWLVRHVISPAFEALCRRRTFAVHRFLAGSQWWSAEQLRALQLRKLRRLVGVAMQHTAGYADLAGLDRDWLPTSLDDLRRLPRLDKATLRENRKALTNANVPGGPRRYRTGGSSGVPLIFSIDRRRQAWDKAARMRSHDWFAMPHGVREAYIWNAPVELDKQGRARQLRDTLTNERIFPAWQLSEQSLAGYVASLRRFGPDCLFGYPNAIELMCRLAEQQNIRLDDLGAKVVFSTAEVLYPAQREFIASALGLAVVADGYGSREAGFIAHECPHGTMHITSENVIAEVLDEAGEPVGPGVDGEIVVTQLDNFAQPFIRYRTDDIGQLAAAPCPCGRGLETMRVVQGRSNDFLLAPDGRRVHSSAVHASLSNIEGIARFQLRQDPAGAIRVLLVKTAAYPAGGDASILAGLHRYLGADAPITIEPCEDIPPSASGKFRYVIRESE
jgi:phenylacetate-CoA ligase